VEETHACRATSTAPRSTASPIPPTSRCLIPATRTTRRSTATRTRRPRASRLARRMKSREPWRAGPEGRQTCSVSITSLRMRDRQPVALELDARARRRDDQLQHAHVHTLVYVRPAGPMGAVPVALIPLRVPFAQIQRGRHRCRHATGDQSRAPADQANDCAKTATRFAAASITPLAPVTGPQKGLRPCLPWASAGVRRRPWCAGHRQADAASAQRGSVADGAGEMALERSGHATADMPRERFVMGRAVVRGCSSTRIAYTHTCRNASSRNLRESTIRA
jgi:hypothetical protein